MDKSKFHHFWPPRGKILGYPWKNPLLTPLEKIFTTPMPTTCVFVYMVLAVFV